MGLILRVLSIWKVPSVRPPRNYIKILNLKRQPSASEGENSKRGVDTDAGNATHHSSPAIRVSSYIDHTSTSTPSGEGESHRNWNDVILSNVK
jgi:hypothetical protein